MLRLLLNLLFPMNSYEQLLAHTSVLQGDPSHIATPQCGVIHTASRDSDQALHAALRMHKKTGSAHTTSLLANLLEDFLIEELSDILLWENVHPLIIPIPQSRTRTRARGFNHLQLICNALSPDLKASVRTDILVQPTEVPMQKLLSRNARFQNVKDIYSVSPKISLQGVHVCVFDDITTTGATLASARRTLEQAGARVTTVAIAHA